MKLEQDKPERREVAWTGSSLHAAVDRFAAGCKMRAVRQLVVERFGGGGTSAST
jgi:hypothetical protein